MGGRRSIDHWGLALERFRPATVGQAGRIEGVNPPDMTLILVALKRLSDGRRRAGVAASLV